MATGALIPIFTDGIRLINGNPAALAKVFSFVAGTSQEQALFTDAALLVAHPNPLTLDSSGRVSGGVYFQAKSYKIRVDDSADVLNWQQDNWQDVGQVQLAAAQVFTAKSQVFNLDNGAGTIIDDVIMRLPRAVTISAARIVYVDAAAGTVAAGTVQLGTSVGGAELVGATNYENGKAIGSASALVLATAAVAANQPVHVRHVGVAATQAGQAYVAVDYA